MWFLLVKDKTNYIHTNSIIDYIIIMSRNEPTLKNALTVSTVKLEKSTTYRL